MKEDKHIMLYGVFKNPLLWLRDLPYRVALVTIVTMIVPFGFLLLSLFMLLGTVQEPDPKKEVPK